MRGRPWVAALTLGLSIIVAAVPLMGADSPGTPDGYALLAEASRLVQEERLAEAVAVLRKIPAPAPGEDAGLFVRSRIDAAKILLGLGDLDGASASCHEVLALLPSNLEAKNLLNEIRDARTPRWVKFLRDMKTYLPTLLRATGMTLLLVLATMLISPVAGLAIALGRISRMRVVSGVFWCYIWVFRGTPLLLQLFFIYYGLPSLGVTLEPLTAAILGLGLNYSAYLAEIIRGAIESIDAGQMEAAKALGMTYWQAMRRIIIPQTYRRLVPPVGNEFIALIKDTALVSTIAMVELMRAANQIYSATFNVFILFQAAIVYLVLTSFFTVAFRRLEDALGVYEIR
ncbi:MAG TPA: amino acid ABC transporter permease [Deltaproteobacteria bacterium]|nr:amino acid ABC transporter permease [Deltaproteobacteria bacterium]HOM28394.1 amino acid ABC transporter permease [Deltaproteobacteria bacterium]HPP80355.1 amino acid ABC transporter permease [Deltaproteobacteria bacterium]